MTEAEQTRKFYELIWPHMATVLRHARFITPNGADGDDLAQETMLKAFKAMSTLREGSNVKAWLLRILHNALIDRHRQAPKGMVSLDELGHDSAAIPCRPSADSEIDFAQDAEAVLNSFSDAQVIAALRELPPDIRRTLLLVDVEGLNDGEAAEILDIPAGTVKSRLHRGRRMLRDALLPLARQLRLVGC